MVPPHVPPRFYGAKVCRSCQDRCSDCVDGSRNVAVGGLEAIDGTRKACMRGDRHHNNDGKSFHLSDEMKKSSEKVTKLEGHGRLLFSKFSKSSTLICWTTQSKMTHAVGAYY